MFVLAYAADEALQRTRLCGGEDVDNSRLPFENAKFTQRIVTLFGPPQRCWESGHTRFILERLAIPVMVLVGNMPKTIGGPGTVDDATKQRCVARLSAWCTLAKSTIKAEFPSFDVLCAFAVFGLTPRDDQQTEPLC